MMNVKQLIEALSKCHGDTPVNAWDYDESEYMEVTGLDWDITGSWIYLKTSDGDER
jgi:hypothetical protein